MAQSQATANDLVARSLRPLTPTELAWAAVRLRDAFTQIVTRRPSVAARIDAGNSQSPFNQLVIQVQCAMVLRVLANPEYARQQAADDYTVVLDSAVSSGALYVSDDELALLSVGDSVSDTVFTVRPKPNSTRTDPGAWFPTTTTGVW